MSQFSARLLYWLPRVITIALTVFLSLFALEAFNQFHVWWRVSAAFAIGLVPALIVVAVLVAAWRWEWIGAAAFALLAIWYSWGMLHRHHLTWPIALSIPLPLLVIAGLFLAGWIKRAKLRPAH